jgi:hypothetical protein
VRAEVVVYLQEMSEILVLGFGGKCSGSIPISSQGKEEMVVGERGFRNHGEFVVILVHLFRPRVVGVCRG